MSKYDCILFDLDGTILDSKPGIFTCIRYALDTKGVKYDERVLDKMVGPPFRVSMKEFLGLDNNLIEELILLYRGMYEVDGWKDCKLYDGVIDMLQKLRAAGKTLAIATSKPIKFTSIIVKGLELEKYFDFVGGASSDSSKESKADVIQLVLDELNVKDVSKVLMVGDRLYDVAGAKSCGVDCAGILWGYGDRQELESYGADFLLQTPADVVDFVLHD